MCVCVRACTRFVCLVREANVCSCAPYIDTHKYICLAIVAPPPSLRIPHPFCPSFPSLSPLPPYKHTYTLFRSIYLSLSLSPPPSISRNPARLFSPSPPPFLAPRSTVIYVSACARRTGQRVSVPLVCLLYYRGSNENLCRHKRSCQQHAA